jgi:hypothetical protein
MEDKNSSRKSNLRETYDYFKESKIFKIEVIIFILYEYTILTVQYLSSFFYCVTNATTASLAYVELLCFYVLKAFYFLCLVKVSKSY